MPWSDLVAGGWTIVGCNHYRVRGVLHLFVAMTRLGRCITAEGPDEDEVFAALQRYAEAA